MFSEMMRVSRQTYYVELAFELGLLISLAGYNFRQDDPAD
jgi:hypothetical protein